MAFDPLTAIFNLGTSLVDRLVPDKSQAAAAKQQLEQMKTNGELQQLAADSSLQLAEVSGQLQANVAEASSAAKASNSFVQFWIAGWRPAVGWAGAMGFAYVTIGQPILTFAAKIMGSHIAAPTIDSSVLTQVLFGLLGLGTMRTVEKVKGINAGQ